MVEQRPVRAVPAWLTALVLVACLGGGGAFAWWVARDGVGDRIVVLDRAPGDGVRQTGRDAYKISAGYAAVNVRAPEGAAPAFAFYFEKYDFLAPDQVETLAVARRIERDRAVAALIGLTPRQAEAVREVRKGAKVELTPADAARLAGLWPAYGSAGADPAARRKAEGRLLAAVEEISERLVGPVRQSAAERAARMRTVLTPEQWERLDQMGT